MLICRVKTKELLQCDAAAQSFEFSGQQLSVRLAEAYVCHA